MGASGAALFALGCALLAQPAGPERIPGTAGGAPVEIAADDARPWSVLVISDVQRGFHYLGEIFEHAAPFEPKAVIALGDLSRQPDRAHLGLVARELERTPPSAPFFAIPGNHDVFHSAGRAAFIGYYGATHFDLTLGRTRVLGVDNSSGPVAPEDLDILRRALVDAAARGQRVVLAAHRPPAELEGCEDRQPELAELIREFRVAVVLSGHCHHHLTLRRDGTLFVVAPATGDEDVVGVEPEVSFLLLRWSGSDFQVAEHSIERSNLTELEGELLHVVLGHLRPRLSLSDASVRRLSAALAFFGCLCVPWPWRSLARRAYHGD